MIVPTRIQNWSNCNSRKTFPGMMVVQAILILSWIQIYCIVESFLHQNLSCFQTSTRRVGSHCYIFLPWCINYFHFDIALVLQNFFPRIVMCIAIRDLVYNNMSYFFRVLAFPLALNGGRDPFLYRVHDIFIIWNFCHTFS
jgi:hypothetical protein